MSEGQTIGERLKLRRLERKFSQSELATKVGIWVQQISEYERGVKAPTGANLVALAQVLETTTDYLLGATKEPGNGKRPRARASS